jgi:hypothetical protein
MPPAPLPSHRDAVVDHEMATIVDGLERPGKFVRPDSRETPLLDAGTAIVPGALTPQSHYLRTVALEPISTRSRVWGSGLTGQYTHKPRLTPILHNGFLIAIVAEKRTHVFM